MELNGEYLQDLAQIEQYTHYFWGEDLLLVIDDGDRYLVNRRTGKVRLISCPGHVLGFSDSEIDFATLNKIPLSHNARSRSLNYGGLGRWDDCEDGLIALSWKLHPEGEYFADEDGYGMIDCEDLTVYCVMDDNLNVIRPFTVVPDIAALLKEMRQAKRNISAQFEK